MVGGIGLTTRCNVLGVSISTLDQRNVVEQAIRAARDRRPLSVSALAVHGIMVAIQDKTLRYRINALDINTADGQPVRWAVNLLCRAGMRERVYGPDLMLALCTRARDNNISIFLYGCTTALLTALEKNLMAAIPDLKIAGMQASRFRSASEEEQIDDLRRIQQSEAGIIFVGLGCPRQEIWAFENTADLSIPVIAVGAAFAYHAGELSEPPRWMMRYGLQWLFRLAQEPLRLWRRYLLLNPLYLFLLFLQATGLRRFRLESSLETVAPVRPG